MSKKKIKKISCITDVCITMAVVVFSIAGVSFRMQFVIFALSVIFTITWFLFASYQKWQKPILITITLFVLSLKEVHYAETPIWFNTISFSGAVIFTASFLLLNKKKNTILMCVSFLAFYIFFGGALSYANVALANEEDFFLESALVKNTYTEGRLGWYSYNVEALCSNGTIVYLDIPQSIYKSIEPGDSIFIKRVKSFYSYYVYDTEIDRNTREQ